jgi:hypothetical protein
MIQNLNQNAQSTLPETFDTNSSITRVFPVPQAICSSNLGACVWAVSLTLPQGQLRVTSSISGWKRNCSTQPDNNAMHTWTLQG